MGNSAIRFVPLEKPMSGTGLSISELGKAFDQIQGSVIAGSEVRQDSFGNVIGTPAEQEVLAMIGTSTGTAPHKKWEWYRVYLNEDQDYEKVSSGNPDGDIVNGVNYVIDPAEQLTEGCLAWINYDVLNGLWVVKSVLNTPASEDWPEWILFRIDSVTMVGDFPTYTISPMKFDGTYLLVDTDLQSQIATWNGYLSDLSPRPPIKVTESQRPVILGKKIWVYDTDTYAPADLNGVAKYMLYVPGIKTSTSEFTGYGVSSIHLPEAAKDLNVSELTFNEDFKLTELDSTYSSPLFGQYPKKTKVEVRYASRFQSGLIEANYAYADVEGEGGTRKFGPLQCAGNHFHVLWNTYPAAQWIGNGIKCFEQLYSELGLAIGYFDASQTGLDYDPPQIALGAGGGVLNLLRDISPAEDFDNPSDPKVDYFSGITSAGSLTLRAWQYTSETYKPEIGLGYIHRPGLYSSSLATSGFAGSGDMIGFNTLSLYNCGIHSERYIWSRGAVYTGKYTTDSTTSWGFSANGMPSAGYDTGQGGLYAWQNSTSLVAGHMTVAGVNNGELEYAAILRIGNYTAPGFAGSFNPGILQISKAGKISCDQDSDLVETGAGIGETGSVYGFSFANGWCTVIPTPPADGSILTLSGGSFSATGTMKVVDDLIRILLPDDRWIGFGVTSL